MHCRGISRIAFIQIIHFFRHNKIAFSFGITVLFYSPLRGIWLSAILLKLLLRGSKSVEVLWCTVGFCQSCLKKLPATGTCDLLSKWLRTSKNCRDVRLNFVFISHPEEFDVSISIENMKLGRGVFLRYFYKLLCLRESVFKTAFSLSNSWFQSDLRLP